MNRKIAVLTIAAALAGCGGGDGGSSPSVTSNSLVNLSTLSNASAELQTVQCNQLQLVGKNYVQPNTVDSCWLLEVPEDYTQPEGKKIKVAVAKTLSQGPKKGAFLFLNGGPGGMSIDRAQYSNNRFSVLSANHDIYFVDQRGTGYSTPSLSCEFEDSGTAQQIKDCKDKYVNDGVSLNQYTNVNNALDLLLLEKKLSEVKEIEGVWKLYGVSYGTRLAMTMAREEQKQINAGYQTSNAIQMMVLDGVFPIEMNGIKDMPWSNYAALDRILEVCARSTGYCDEAKFKSDLNTKFAQIDEKYHDFFVSYLTTTSMLRDDSKPADGAFNPVELMKLTKAQIESGLDVLIAHKAKAYDPTSPSQFAAMGLANICSEEPVKQKYYSSHHESRAKWGADVQKAIDNSTHYGLTLEACQAMNVESVSSSSYVSMEKVDYPVLILNGANDGITPPALADISAKKFSNMLSLTYDQGSHGILTDAQDWVPCLKNLILSSINEPENMRSLDSTCLNTSDFKYVADIDI
ncbi:alpha/beta fold hydrolase [Vibrio europaeus]|uniref:Alpha/beta fold hydrolase n=2 Tax=Vibrio europaeus TaxID=300876 RepID=A0AAE7AZR8_9VIBR|nr:alpha/beta fold hydrolase [Vibrio europaeus]MDC5811147.1 alpha/beta fold hydrolase [Vibrio europaeus]MDC5826378.1 alpha/beta fold hydrolase [Vibrio europaeus]MDC5856743.1 alpha/beta fold hydrolase [Vibrio europaeus]QJY38283.1 alpha/beta fold hydrolase [Vibrio europaeus]